MAAKPALSSSRSREPLPSASRQWNTFSMDADSCADTQADAARTAKIWIRSQRRTERVMSTKAMDTCRMMDSRKLSPINALSLLSSYP